MALEAVTMSATEQPIFETLCIATATEHSAPLALAVQVLLRTADIEQLCEAERSFAPRRSLQLLARKALKFSQKLAPTVLWIAILNICSLGDPMLRAMKTLMLSSGQELLWPWQSSLKAPRIQTEEGNHA